jgi:hypothetical protein
VSYLCDDDFERAKVAALASVNPARARVLRLAVHHADPAVDPFDAIVTARSFVAALGLYADDLRYFAPVLRARVEVLCTYVAAHELCHGRRQMPLETASRLASLWLAEFGDDTVFFTNIVSEGRTVETRGSLLHTDLEAGVIAVSPTRAGLFWNGENS